jgi:hypothetical protein
MSIFKVEVVRINNVNPHPNADRLDIATFEGMAYQVITGKGNFKPGDLAFYFPIDSVIPDAFLDEFGFRPYYSKKLRAGRDGKNPGHQVWLGQRQAGDISVCCTPRRSLP